MSSESYGADIPLTNSPQDLAAIWPTMAGTLAWVHNRGPSHIIVQFSSSPVAPTGGGRTVRPGEDWAGEAAHCWAWTIGNATPSTVAVGTI